MKIAPHACHELSRRAGGAGGACGRAMEDIRKSGSEPDFRYLRSRYGKSGSDPDFASARDFLDAGDHLVDRLLHRPLVGDHAVHRLRPHVLVVEDGELVVPGELEVTVPAENWSCTTLRCGSSVQYLRAAAALVTGYQRPSAPSTYGVRFSSRIRKATNSLPRFLLRALSKITPTLTAARYCIGLPSGLFGKPAVAISS